MLIIYHGCSVFSADPDETMLTARKRKFQGESLALKSIIDKTAETWNHDSFMETAREKTILQTSYGIEKVGLAHMRHCYIKVESFSRLNSKREGTGTLRYRTSRVKSN